MRLPLQTEFRQAGCPPAPTAKMAVLRRLAFSFFLLCAILRFVSKAQSRLQVQKTYKLYIGGKFVRGENGRVLSAFDAQGGALANFCRASKKDLRDAVLAARTAFAGWSKQSAYLRGQILYRAAEMLAMRKGELQSEVARPNGARRSTSSSEATLAVDRLVHYAGWAGQVSPIFGFVNSVA